MLFGYLYRFLDNLATFLTLSDAHRADLLVAGPKTFQALFAATGDYYTWKLAENIFGKDSNTAWTTLALTVLSPWQWFCSTRTLSNSLETTLTVIALYTWPWHWSLPEEQEEAGKLDENGLRIRDTDEPPLPTDDELARLVRALLLAAIATVLRPTNILIWIAVTVMTFFRPSKVDKMVKIPWTDQQAMLHFSAWELVPTTAECQAMLVESVTCGGLILLLSAVVDRFFYGLWTLPPYSFLYVNVVQSLAVFYGRNDWHYYLSQGYPLLLTAALPFTILGLYQIFSSRGPYNSQPLLVKNILYSLATACLFVPAVLSMISHKEVRFIYPLLPALHIITAPPLHDFFAPTIQNLTSHHKLKQPNDLTIRILLGLILLLNATIAIYTTTTHNSGLLHLTTYLRHEYTHHHHPSHPTQNMSVAFLMPCHSTPWRSHLQFSPSQFHPGISAWALTCEPPLDIPLGAERLSYVDEADAFYTDPATWLKRNMLHERPQFSREMGLYRRDPINPAPKRHKLDPLPGTPAYLNGAVVPGGTTKREWPDYLAFFAQLSPQLDVILRGSGYKECQGGRIFNSHFHDDWRRKGDIIVLCANKERWEDESVLIERTRQREASRAWRHGYWNLLGRAQWSWKKGDWSFGGGNMVTGFQYGLKEKVEDVAADVKDAVKGETGGKKVLTGGKGPWGVGSGSGSSSSSSSTVNKLVGAQQAPLLERINPMRLFGSVNTDNPNTEAFGSARPGSSWFSKLVPDWSRSDSTPDSSSFGSWRRSSWSWPWSKVQRKERGLWERILWGGDQVVDAGRRVGDRVRREAGGGGGGGAWT